ncbi:hypothetical protein PROFUN_16423 [Planoprotostelium fungivorum]|uniref:Uncharacterized protein n=1 Tax=Planoprotostelium fungivorum TaxID=1890364 RepID=A0A2P6MQP9_9EUKA|nr:hypothetical protein PROFUN_16423 [Planoprotostelium fungivorum]
MSPVFTVVSVIIFDVLFDIIFGIVISVVIVETSPGFMGTPEMQKLALLTIYNIANHALTQYPLQLYPDTCVTNSLSAEKRFVFYIATAIQRSLKLIEDGQVQKHEPERFFIRISKCQSGSN